MKRAILKLTACALFAAAILAAPAISRAQDATSTNAPVKAHKKHDHSVFSGKLSAIDTNAMTLTIGERTFEVTSETKITKDDQPATLSAGMVGEKVGGAYKKSEDGKLTATTIHFGDKKKKGTSESSSTNSVSK
jgi:hypothetical protein